jgi:Domain of unknown function (DUF4259)
MGAWGTGPFDNDDAADFLAEISETPNGQIGGRLSAVLTLSPTGYLELLDACEAIAAAGLVAVARGAVFEDLEEEVVDLVRTDGIAEDEQLRDAALVALARVTGHSSEWQESWSESDAAEEAVQAIADLRTALG